jgi:hypothetical protein
MLVVLVFLALLREPRAEGATRVPPAALGRDEMRKERKVEQILPDSGTADSAALQIDEITYQMKCVERNCERQAEIMMRERCPGHSVP